MFQVFRLTPPAEYAGAGLANSGEKPDMQGVVFDDGSVAVHWTTDYASHVIWPNWQTLYSVHIDPHQNYGTRVEWSSDFELHHVDDYGGWPTSELIDGGQDETP